jgi:hypothetical protein
MADRDVQVPPSQFIDFARQSMPALAEQFKSAAEPNPAAGSYPNFWQIGCVFDTILDYFLALKESPKGLQPDDTTLLAEIMASARKGYQWGIVGLAAAWYDDWCWWGIAASKAFDKDYEDLFSSEDRDFFQNAALNLWGLVDFGDFATMAESIPDDIWKHAAKTSAPDSPRFTKEMLSARADVHKGTRNSWRRIEGGATGHGTPRQNADYKAFTDPHIHPEKIWAVPRFAGGCWQYDPSTLQFAPNDGPNWSDPSPASQTLGMFQLTLMQGLYLSFCCSLAAAARRKADESPSGGAWDRLQPFQAYWEPAGEVVDFLTNWIEADSHSLASRHTDGTLLHERPRVYATKPDGIPGDVNGYTSDFFWSGDQGLIMGALVQYGDLAGPPPANAPDRPVNPIYETYPLRLLNGVFARIHTSTKTNPPELSHAIGPYIPYDKPISGDSGDYGSGSGIFWRYVTRCCRIDARFGAHVRSSEAMTRIATRSGTNDNNWGNELFTAFNTVAAAVGAWHLFK